MSQPTPADVHVDAALTDISVAYVQNETNFVSGQVFPAVPVNHQTDKYFKFDKNDWFRDDAVTKRSPNQESSGSGYGLSTDTYSADVWATHVDIDDQVRANADPAVDPEEAATRIVTQRMLIRRERQFATDYFTTSVWDTDVVGSTDFTKWSDYGSSDPAENIDAGREGILGKTGFEPNTLLVSYEVHNVLKKHPLVLERFKYTSSDSVTAQMLARYFEVDRYLVSKAVYATNEEDASSETYSFAFGKNALLCYVNPAPALMMPSAGYNFVWSRLTGLNNMGTAISNIDMRPSGKKVDRIEGEFSFDMKAVSTDLGYFFSAAVD